MSYTLSGINQIRFPGEDTPWGSFQIVINRPGFTNLTLPAAQTLKLSRVTQSGANFANTPYIIGDVELSKKFTTTKNRRAMDDIAVDIRDSIGYSGTVNGVNVAENFAATYDTFFSVWFTGTEPFKAFLLWIDTVGLGSQETAQVGWIDPTYEPSKDPIVLNPCTSSQVWIGTRTIKITALSNAQIGLTWRDVLLNISQSDLTFGNNAYNGYMMAPDTCSGKNNTRSAVFGTTNTGSIYQACPHMHLYSTSQDPILIPFSKSLNGFLPPTPWISDTLSNQIANVNINLGTGTGYVAGDRVFVNGAIGSPATFEIDSVNGSGSPISGTLLFAGAGYATGTATTAAITGTGTGLTLSINKLGTGQTFGPRGLAFITIGKLFKKIAHALGISFTSATDLVSALDFYRQIPDNVLWRYPVDTTPLNILGLYVSMNVFGKSHPYDGSYWDNPVGFSPDTSIMDVLTSFCDFLLVNFNEIADASGNSALKLTRFGEGGATLPAYWQPSPSASQDESTSNARVVQVQYRGDKLITQAPLGVVGDARKVEIPVRLHRMFLTSGVSVAGDTETLTYDGGVDVSKQAEECFEIVWFDQNGVADIRPNCWKGLCYLYYFNASNTNVAYPDTWDPFDPSGTWANSFYVVSACYAHGVALPTDNLQIVPKGNSYFNSHDYHAVAFAALTLSGDAVQSFDFAGTTDDSGSIQAIGAGMAGVWRHKSNPAQNWSAIEIVQKLKAGITVAKMQAQGATGFPALTDVTFCPLSTSSGTETQSGSGNNSGSTQTGVPIGWNLVTPAALTANTNDWFIGQTGQTVAYISSTGDVNLTGITNGNANSFVYLVNKGSHNISLLSGTGSTGANQFLFAGQGSTPKIVLGPNGGRLILYDASVSKWRVL